MEKDTTAQDHLRLITEMINKAKNNFSENGTLFLLWGFLIFFCSLAYFIGVKFLGIQQSYYIWFLTWIATAYQIFYLKKREKRAKVKLHNDQIVNSIWLYFVVALTLVSFLLIYNKHYYSILPMTLMLYGIPTILTGVVLRFRPLIIGGLCCWALSVGSVFVPFFYQYLFLAGGAVAGWIIPGMALRQRHLKMVNT